MTLVKTTLLNGVAVIIRMVTLLGINKVLALYVGPAGYAALGQFQNAIQIITTFASGAINTGVTKYTAEYHSDESSQHEVWRTSAIIAVLGSLSLGLGIAIFNRSLAAWFLNDASYGGVFIWFAATLVPFTLNALLMAILNGKKEIERYVIANIAGSAFAFLVTSLMAIRFQLYGALVGLAVYQSFTFLFTVFLCLKAPWFKVRNFFGKFDTRSAINLGKYTVMALTSAVCAPGRNILVRDYLGASFGWTPAGHWEAMSRLSAAYLMFVTTTLAIYYLPRISELKSRVELRREIVKGYRLILPVVTFLGLAMYALRDFIIAMLFSRDFLPMRELFGWQMVGDTLKIGSWILGYVLVGKSMVTLVVITEILFSIAVVLLTMAFAEIFGFQGAAIAHALSYVIHWAVMIWLVRKYVLCDDESMRPACR